MRFCPPPTQTHRTSHRETRLNRKSERPADIQLGVFPPAPERSAPLSVISGSRTPAAPFCRTQNPTGTGSGLVDLICCSHQGELSSAAVLLHQDGTSCHSLCFLQTSRNKPGPTEPNFLSGLSLRSVRNRKWFPNQQENPEAPQSES